jgi:hypothetical protein
MSVWWSVIITVVANGILIFLFQQYVQFRFSKLTDALERERTYSTSSYEAISQSFKAVWKGLTGIERFIMRDLPAQFESGHVGDQWDVVYASYADIRGEMLVLPDGLIANTEATISELERDIDQFMAAARRAVDWQHQDEKLRTETEADLLTRISETLQAAQRNFKKNLCSLQEEYQATARSLLIGAEPEKRRISNPG